MSDSIFEGWRGRDPLFPTLTCARSSRGRVRIANGILFSSGGCRRIALPATERLCWLSREKIRGSAPDPASFRSLARGLQLRDDAQLIPHQSIADHRVEQNGQLPHAGHHHHLVLFPSGFETVGKDFDHGVETHG
jgi:hypothetical protein